MYTLTEVLQRATTRRINHALLPLLLSQGTELILLLVMPMNVHVQSLLKFVTVPTWCCLSWIVSHFDEAPLQLVDTLTTAATLDLC